MRNRIAQTDDAPCARWAAFRDYLDATAAEYGAGLPGGSGDDLLTGVRTGRAVACRAALCKMRELEDSP